MAGEGRKSAIFWAPTVRVPHPSGPHPSGSHLFLVWASHPTRTNPTGESPTRTAGTPKSPPDFKNKIWLNLVLAKLGLAKLGAGQTFLLEGGEEMKRMSSQSHMRVKSASCPKQTHSSSRTSARWGTQRAREGERTGRPANWRMTFRMRLRSCGSTGVSKREKPNVADQVVRPWRGPSPNVRWPVSRATTNLHLSPRWSSAPYQPWPPCTRCHL